MIYDYIGDTEVPAKKIFERNASRDTHTKVRPIT